MKKASSPVLFYLFFFFIFMLSHLYFSRDQQFKPLGDNITYLIGAESFYYDHDFVINDNDFTRLASNHPKALVEHIPIIGKETSSGMHGVSKPLIFMVYLSIFTPIKEELLRAQIANGILLFSWFMILYFLVKRLHDKRNSHFIAATLFTLLLFLSQANFYLNVFHPELFINSIVIVCSLPFFFSGSFSQKRYLYILCGLAGSLLFSEKQLALFFPVVVVGYLFLSKKYKAFFSYIFGLFIGAILIIFLYQVLYGTFTAYDGGRGMIRFAEETLIFKAQGESQIFTFPREFGSRFIEYFFGRNIGVFVYNPSLLLFIILFFFALYRRKEKWWLSFLPVFLYLLTYFFIISPNYSYGGATSLGNRYFFQIYVFVIILTVLSILKLSTVVEESVVIFLIIPVISFSGLIYADFYNIFPRAIHDHIIVPEHKRIFSIFPRELNYAGLIYSDLPIENHWENTYIINGGYPLIREGDNYLLRSNSTSVIFFSRATTASGLSDILTSNGSIKLIKVQDGVYHYLIECQENIVSCVITRPDKS